MATVLLTVEFAGGTPDERERVEGTEQTVYVCQGCEAVLAECEEERLYECGECGAKFPQSEGGGRNGNMCPQCLNKFGSKIADRFCSECREGEVEEMDGVACDCGNAFTVEDWFDHVKLEHLG
jgi:DNA-directed RNA polymerase subunit RPC12/RpoP